MSEASIFAFLLSAGLNETGAAALMGNMFCESGLIACRLQGDFSADYAASAAYTARVDSGALSPEAFASDGRGYGLCQWTFPTRKRALLDFARAEGSGVGSEDTQLRFCVAEFPSEAPGTWEYLKTGTDLYTAADLICRNYERPEVCNSSARYSAALDYLSRLAPRGVSAFPPDCPASEDASPAPSSCSVTAASPSSAANDALPSQTAGTASFPLSSVSLPVLSSGCGGASVAAAQTLLAACGFSCGPSGADGIFGPATTSALTAFQCARGLTPDGILGPATWTSLLT